MTDAKQFLDKYGRLFAPSGSSRWLFCTGSVSLEKQLKDQFPQKKELPSIYASEGTVAHKLASMCVQRDVSPYSYIGETFSADDESDFACKVDIDMAEAVNVYVDYVLSFAKSEDHFISVEKTLDLTGISPYIRSGTSDCWIYLRDSKHLHVFDYKHGKNVYVEEKNNTQMLIYALGVCDDLYKSHKIHFSEINGLTLHIVQPRHPNGGKTRAWNAHPSLLPWFHEFVLAQIRSALTQPYFAPDEHRCKWCPGREFCTERAADAIRSAQLDFNHLMMHAYTQDDAVIAQSPIGALAIDVKEPTFPPVETLTKFEIGSILRWQNKVESFFKDIGAAALAIQRSGERLPFFKLVRGRSNRVWKSRSEALTACRKLGLEDEDLFSEPQFKSPAQIERVLKEKKISTERIKDVIVKPTGELKLAPLSDKRPEVDPSTEAKHDFAEFRE